MFPIVYELEIEGHMAVRDRRKLAKYAKLTLALMVRHWHETFLPLHFTKAAFFRYPGMFRKRARRKKGPPLVKSGRMKRDLMQHIRVTGTEKLMVGAMRGPFYTDLDDPKQPDKALEITTVNRQEEAALGRFGSRMLADAFNSEKAKLKMRIAG